VLTLTHHDVIRAALVDHYRELSRLASEDLGDGLCGVDGAMQDALDKLAVMARIVEALGALEDAGALEQSAAA
jgi:hypothetical protein